MGHVSLWDIWFKYSNYYVLESSINDAAGVQRAALQHFSQNTRGICYSAIIQHKFGTYLNILSKKIYWKFVPLKHNLIIFLFVKDASNLQVCSRLTVLSYHLFSAWQNTKPEQLVWIKAASINRLQTRPNQTLFWWLRQAPAAAPSRTTPTGGQKQMFPFRQLSLI